MRDLVQRTAFDGTTVFRFSFRTKLGWEWIKSNFNTTVSHCMQSSQSR